MNQAAFGWRSHYTLLVLLFVYTMSFIDRQIMGILIQPIKEEFGVSDTAMGVLSGLTFALFYSVLAIPFARYADRANRRNFVAYCCMAWSAMTAICGMATGYWSLALARVGVAVGEAGGTAPSLSMIADHYPPERRGRALGVYWLGPQLGILFGLTLGGWIAQHHGWRAAFLWMAVPGVLAAMLLRYTAVEPPRGAWNEEVAPVGGTTESLGEIVRSLWSSKVFMRIGLAGLCMGFAGYAIGIWTPSFLVRSHGMSLQGAGAVMGLLGGVAAALGALLGGWLCDTLAKRDPRWRIGVPLLGCLLSLPSGLGFYLMPAGDAWHVGDMAMPAAVGLYLIFGVTSVWWMAPVYAVLSELIAPHRRATGLSIFSLGLTMVGGGFGPLCVGLLSDQLIPQFGNEALRISLAVVTGSCFAIGIGVFAWAMHAYADERRDKRG
ncbi:spinster family MFS transporter [Limnohabitans sp.]|jgi:MFS family permease|uniref:spinster family MFS transporter n=1 Tax=Limnohabitans sp. TaxID=1907725 RepID=UPI002FDD6968